MRIPRSIRRITAEFSTASIASPTATARGRTPGTASTERFSSTNGFSRRSRGPVLARHRVAISWHGKDAAFAEEERELTVYNVPGGHLIEFASRLRSPSGRVRIDGDPQHAGFQFRAHNDVDAYTTNETIFIRPDGIGKPGETRNWDPETRQGPVNMPWNAMSFVLGGKRYTVAYLDHPANPKGGQVQRKGIWPLRFLFRIHDREGQAAHGELPAVAAGRPDASRRRSPR